jgi:hypothetical protein
MTRARDPVKRVGLRNQISYSAPESGKAMLAGRFERQHCVVADTCFLDVRELRH